MNTPHETAGLAQWTPQDLAAAKASGDFRSISAALDRGLLADVLRVGVGGQSDAPRPSAPMDHKTADRINNAQEN